MANVKVYHFKKWLVAEERYVASDRLATREMLAANPDLVLIPESETLIDSTRLDGDGLTRRHE